ncbi:MAG: hypothetical protein WHS46_05590 [Desulfosoma sp.]
MTGATSTVIFCINGIPADSEALKCPLPTGLTSDAPSMNYTQYFEALREALQKNGWKPLCESLETLTGTSWTSKGISRVRIDSVKHGALYHVAKIEVQANDQIYAFVMNSAMHPQRQKALEREWKTLQWLANTPVAPYVPRCLYVGQGVWHDDQAAIWPFGFFLATWFEGFYEWHMEKGDDGTAATIRVWDESSSGTVLSSTQTAELMEQASYLLTLALDRKDFFQIYPWHHAAGDFVVAVDDRGLSVRLISARNRAVLMPSGPLFHERFSALAAFFFVLTFRMRVDRHRGTEDLVWASAQWLEPVVRGFLRGWTDGASTYEPLTARDILSLLQAFDASDWEAVGSLLQEDLVVDVDEGPLVLKRLQVHARDLGDVLRRGTFQDVLV